jgi:hypothetical protein
MRDLTMNPLWYLLLLGAFGGVGYFTGGRLGAVEGFLFTVVLAHGALLEVLREKLAEIDELRTKLSVAQGSIGNSDD